MCDTYTHARRALTYRRQQHDLTTNSILSISH